MRKMAGLLMALCMLIGFAIPAAADDEEVSARAHQKPINHSGISSHITFMDTGTSLIVDGRAHHLDSAKKYFSLLYDNASVPTGPNACEETLPTLSEAQMFLGFWDSKKETLHAVQTGPAYTAIGTFATMSIRQLLDPNGPPSPTNQKLVACGQVRIEHED